MISWFLKKFMRGVAVTGLVWVAAIAFAPICAKASCGDYVTIRGQVLQSIHPIRQPQEMPDSSLPNSPACHGPSCSNHSFPPAAPTPRIAIVVEHGTITVGVIQLESPKSASLLSDTDENRSDGFGLSIFRPPR
jgi:hypothetical protein